MARTRAIDYEDKRQHILETAAEVYCDLGMEKASVSEIARRAGVSKALLYHYYSGKEALIFDIVHSHLQDLDAALEVADKPDAPAEQRLQILIGQVIKNYENADNKHRVQLNSMGTLPEEQAEALREIERRIVRRFVSIIREINSEIDSERPLAMPVTMSLFGILNWTYMWFRPGGGLSRDEYAGIITTLMLEGVKAIR